MKKLFLFASLAFSAINVTSAQDVVLWGGAGSNDGEFNGGLNGWTTVGISDPAAVWAWNANSKSIGAYAGTTGLVSASSSNGAAVFDSDYLDNGGIAGNFGKGAAASPHNSELISPTIDLTGTNDVTLVFSQLFRKFQSNRPSSGEVRAATAIMYSRDNGATWSDPIGIEINEYIKTNQSTSQFKSSPITRVQLPGAGGTAQFKVKFSFDGDYYFWIIDDVAIVKMEDYNLRANINFYATAENVLTPVTQTRPFYFLNDIANIGAKAQENVKHTMSIYKTNSAGQLIAPAVFTDTLNYGRVEPDTTIENVSFPKGFEATGTKSPYAGFYQLISENDDIEPTNNTLSFVFATTDSTFAKDNGRTRSVAPAFASGDAPVWGYGNVYYIKNGKNFRSGSVQFGLEGTADNIGETVEAKLYKWTPSDSDDDSIDEEELEVVGSTEYTITGKEAAVANGGAGNTRLSLGNWNEPGKPITLEDNTYYVVYVEHTGTSTDNSVSLSAYERYNYNAVNLAFEGAGKFSRFSMIKIGDGLSEGGFRDMVPVIRWNIRENIINAKETLLSENVVSVSPNPAVNNLNVKFTFETVMKNVDVTLFDVNGREVMVANFNNISKDNYNLDITSLASGLYNLVVRTETGVTNKNVLIQK